MYSINAPHWWVKMMQFIHIHQSSTPGMKTSNGHLYLVVLGIILCWKLFVHTTVTACDCGNTSSIKMDWIPFSSLMGMMCAQGLWLWIQDGTTSCWAPEPLQDKVLLVEMMTLCTLQRWSPVLWQEVTSPPNHKTYVSQFLYQRM